MTSDDHAKLIGRVEELVDADRMDDAVRTVAAPLAADPDSPRLNALMAIAMARSSDGAIEQAERAIELDPLDPFGHFALGFAHLMRSNHEAARESYQYSLGLEGHPRRVDAYNHLASALLYLDDGPAARAVLGAATEEFPDNFDVHETLAQVLLAEGNRAEARKVFWRLFRTRPSPPTFEDWVRTLFHRRIAQSSMVLGLVAFAALLGFGGRDPNWSGRAIAAYTGCTIAVTFGVALLVTTFVSWRWRRHRFRWLNLLLGLELLVGYVLVWWGPRFGIATGR